MKQTAFEATNMLQWNTNFNKTNVMSFIYKRKQNEAKKIIISNK